MARPLPEHVWQRVQTALASKSREDAAWDEAPALDAPKIFWPLFVLVLLANGWFIKPRVFNLQPVQQTSVRRRQIMALLRIPVFIGVWIVAFAFLPSWLASGLLLAWGVVAFRGVRKIHEQFQSIPASTGF